MQRQRINHIRWVAGEMGGGVGGGGAGTIAHLWLAGPSWLAWCAVTVTDVQAAQAAYRLATATHLYRAGNPLSPLLFPLSSRHACLDWMEMRDDAGQCG